MQGGIYCLQSTNVISLRDNTKAAAAIKYLLGVLNSSAVNYYFRQRFSGNNHIASNQLGQIPIPAPRSEHLDLVNGMVEQMLNLHKRLADEKNEGNRAIIQRQINSTDREIDKLVYELYGLTEEEIKIVESASLASLPNVEENEQHEQEAESHHRPGPGESAARPMAEEIRHAGESGGGSSECTSEAGEPVHGVRESTGEYGAPEEPGESEESALGSTRTFETAEGVLTYTELSERLAVPLIALHDEILNSHPDHLSLTTEWLCQCHKRLAGHLFPDWAGRYRDVNVQVGPHTPPPFYEVPIYTRQFCDDLTERLKHVDRSVEALTPLLAWADWRFQWIHPFRDFNGRIGRVLLAALLYKFGLPHVTTAPDDGDSRRAYLEALRSGDAGDLSVLNELWLSRLVGGLQEGQ
jgi:fido (protein-threonine AMPylation protein)